MQCLVGLRGSVLPSSARGGQLCFCPLRPPGVRRKCQSPCLWLGCVGWVQLLVPEVIPEAQSCRWVSPVLLQLCLTHCKPQLLELCSGLSRGSGSQGSFSEPQQPQDVELVAQTQHEVSPALQPLLSQHSLELGAPARLAHTHTQDYSAEY